MAWAAWSAAVPAGQARRPRPKEAQGRGVPQNVQDAAEREAGGF